MTKKAAKTRTRSKPKSKSRTKAKARSRKKAVKTKKPARARKKLKKLNRPELFHPPGYYFDEAAADKAVTFFEKFLVHVKGEWAGRPFKLTPWERDEIIRPLFGWKRPDGTRQYRVVYAEVPRKNGKSTLAAGVALYLTLPDQEPGAEVYSAANGQSQASIVFDIAKQMASKARALRKRLQIYRYAITAEALGASYKVLSSKAETKDGLNAHGIIFDELHGQPNRDLWDVLTTSVGTRRQPVTFVITTAGFDKNSVCWEQHEYALKVRDGIINDPELLPVICAADEDDDWTDPKVWAKANPNLGVTVKLDYLKSECAKAQESPAYENTFKRLHLNIWTEQMVRWLKMTRWDACAGVVNEAELLGRPCFGGLDLASTTDLAALVLVFPDDEKPWQILPHFWVPDDNVRRRVRRDRVPYDVWIREELVTATPGNVIDYDRIRAHINAQGERFDIRELAIDRWNATQITTQLMGDGFEVVMFGQGFASMSAPTRELEKKVLGGQIIHGGNPVLRWNASNVSVKTDAAGNMKPDKEHSSDRIDGIVATIMAIGRAMITNVNAGESVYETHGIRTI